MTDGNPVANQSLLSGPLKPKLLLAAGVLALTGVIAMATMNLREPQYSVLFANLSDRDGGSIIEGLNKQNIPYRFAAGGNAIMVPTNLVHGIRLKLASEGLPRGANVGFELIDQQGFGVTQFQEKLNYQRGLQGELTRSIESLAAVESARVHLSIPNSNGFLRAQSKASASVLVQLYPGQYLDRNQTAGIVHLVAASIGRLSPKDVTVIDQNGNMLLNRNADSTGPDPTQISYVQNVENRLSSRVIELLEPIVGRGNVRARVTADIDFTATQSTDEIYKPNQSAQQAAIRSQQTRVEGGNGANGGAGGIPGALTNQPGAAGQAPVNGAAQNPQAANAAGQGGGAAQNASNRESVTNYEVDKSIRVTRNEVGGIRRLTAAVVINHRRNVDDEGKATYTPLAPEELQKIDALVRQAIGFTENRGDAINIMNSVFAQEPVVPVVEVPIWKDPQMTGLALEILKHLGIVLLGLLTIFKVIKPALRTIAAPVAIASNDPTNQTGGNVNAVVEGDVDLPPPQSPKVLTAQVSAEAQRLAQENPAAVANVVRDWVAEA